MTTKPKTTKPKHTIEDLSPDELEVLTALAEDGPVRRRLLSETASRALGALCDRELAAHVNDHVTAITEAGSRYHRALVVLTPSEVEKRVERIASEARADEEKASGLEHELHGDVLFAIAIKSNQPLIRAMAATAFSTTGLNFRRWG